MWLSAVSGIVFGIGSLPQQSLTREEDSAWSSIRQRVVTLTANGSDIGTAVSLGGSGYFLAHRSLVSFPILFGRLSSGRMVQLELRSSDETTQLALLQAPHGLTLDVPGVEIAPEPTGSMPKVIAILPNGPLRAQLVSADRLGILSESRRVVPLCELSFEAPLSKVGGAPVFTLGGKLLGILNATLPLPSNAQSRNANALSGGQALGGQLTRPFGPQALTVGYAVGPSALSKVVAGFLSPSHQVQHVALGILIKDAHGEGAEIQSVTPKSAAESAGLQSGDIIFELAGQPVRNQIDYAKIMMNQEIGKTILIRFKRGGETMSTEATPKD